MSGHLSQSFSLADQATDDRRNRQRLIASAGVSSVDRERRADSLLLRRASAELWHPASASPLEKLPAAADNSALHFTAPIGIARADRTTLDTGPLTLLHWRAAVVPRRWPMTRVHLDRCVDRRARAGDLDQVLLCIPVLTSTVTELSTN